MHNASSLDRVKPHSFATLDGLRGIAATAVVLFHCPSLVGMQLVPHGYLAVDFFFMLSGFVLTHAYQRRLEQGWTVAAFLRVRIARLYPLYVFALVFGFIVVRIQTFHGTNVGTAQTHFKALALGLCFLPFLGNASVSLFPLNMPSWSVFFELLANFIHVTLYRKTTSGRLALGVLIGLSGTLFAAFKNGNLDFGAYVPLGYWAVFRVLLSYTIGIALFRYWATAKHRFNLSPLLCVGLLLLLLILPVHGLLFEFFVVLIAFPMLLLASAGSEPTGKRIHVFLWLGHASYAVYVLQAPLLQVFNRLWPRIARHAAQELQPWSAMIYVCMLVLLSLFLDRVYDLPVRTFLKRLLTSRESKAVVPSSLVGEQR